MRWGLHARVWASSDPPKGFKYGSFSLLVKSRYGLQSGRHQGVTRHCGPGRSSQRRRTKRGGAPNSSGTDRSGGTIVERQEKPTYAWLEDPRQHVPPPKRPYRLIGLRAAKNHQEGKERETADHCGRESSVALRFNCMPSLLAAVAAVHVPRWAVGWASGNSAGPRNNRWLTAPYRRTRGDAARAMATALNS